MEFFSFNALEDGLSLPEGSLEISPKVLGKVIMLAIAKADRPRVHDSLGFPCFLGRLDDGRLGFGCERCW